MITAYDSVDDILGFVDISSQEYAYGGDASEDPAIVFEEAEHNLDLVALFIEKPVGVALD